MKIEDIKPCPFCGGLVKDHPRAEGELFIVEHNKGCYMGEPRGFYYLLYKSNIKKWNTRKMGRKNTP